MFSIYELGRIYAMVLFACPDKTVDKTVPDKSVPNCKIFPGKTVPDKNSPKNRQNDPK